MRIEKKIDNAGVQELRERAAAGESDAELAAAFGLSKGTVRGLRTGRARRNASGPLTKRRKPLKLSPRAVLGRLDALEREVGQLRDELAALAQSIDEGVG